MRLALSCLSLCMAFWAEGREVPELTGPIVQEARAFSPRFVDQMSEQLRDIDEKTGIQITVLVIKSLDGDDLNDFSIRVADKWKLGKKGDDRGLIILLTLSERRMRIEVGRGLEGDLPDALAKRIIDQVVTPFFAQRQFDQGLNAGIQAILQRIAPDLASKEVSYKNKAQRRLSQLQKLPPAAVFALFALFFILFPSLLMMMLGAPGPRGNAWMHSGRSPGSWGGGGWGGGSSGGDWSGGGGGFSGGGASGGW